MQHRALAVLVYVAYNHTSPHHAAIFWLYKVRRTLLFCEKQPTMQSQKAHIAASVPDLQLLVQQHEDGSFKGDVGAFNTNIMGKIGTSAGERSWNSSR
jgi:hypothetical protein